MEFLIQSPAEVITKLDIDAEFATLLATIIGVGIALGIQARATRKDLDAKIDALSAEINSLRERMAHLEGLMEGLREAITGRRAA